jgi:hypothetical protein
MVEPGSRTSLMAGNTAGPTLFVLNGATCATG